MTQKANNEAAVYRRKALYKSIERVKKVNPKMRMQLFLDLQQSMQEIYWNGLKNRFPNASDSELKKIALKEAKSRVKHRKLVPKTL